MAHSSHVHACRVLILTAIFAAFPTFAFAQDLAVHTGVPLVLSFMGQTHADGTTDRDLSAHFGADLTFDLSESLQLGGSIDGTYIDGSYRLVDGIVYAFSGGPMFLLTTEKWTGRNVNFGLGITPGVMVLGASDGEGNSRTAFTIGAMTEASIRFRLTQSFSLAVFGSIGGYAAPFGETVWLDQQLGPTILAGVDLGFVWYF